MHLRFSVAAIVMAGIALPGCSLPRGPVNLDPIVPRWLAHGEVSCDCPPESLPHAEEALVDPAALAPPVSKFHPVPTRPVFEPAGEPLPADALSTPLSQARR